MKIPGAERAILDSAKVRDYLVSPEHRVGSAKTRVFAQLGFDHQNWAVLQGELQISNRYADRVDWLSIVNSLELELGCFGSLRKSA